MGLTKDDARRAIRDQIAGAERGVLLQFIDGLIETDLNIMGIEVSDGNKAIVAFLREQRLKAEPGLALMTARQVISRRLPDMWPCKTPRLSHSKTMPVRSRTFGQLRKWKGFDKMMQQLLDSLDDSERRFLPVSLPGNLGKKNYRSAADEAEVRAPLVIAGDLITDVANFMGWNVQILGGGSNRGLSQTDCVIVMGGSRPGTPEAEKQEQDRLVQQGASGVQQKRKRKRPAEAAAGAGVERSRKSRIAPSIARGAEALVAPGDMLDSTPAAAGAGLSKRAGRAAARAGGGDAGRAQAAPAGGKGAQRQQQQARQMQGGRAQRQQEDEVEQARPSPGQQGAPRVPRQEGGQSQRQQQGNLLPEAAQKILACLEVKGDWQWKLKPSEQLLELHELRPKDLQPAVHQVFGDMVCEEALLGLVTNYRATVLFKRDTNVESKDLYVSPTIGVDRLSLALLLLAKLAWDNRELKLPRVNVPVTPEEERKEKRQKPGLDTKKGRRPRQEQGQQPRTRQGQQQKKQQSSARKGGKKGQGQKGQQGHTSKPPAEEQKGGTQQQQAKQGSLGEQRRCALAYYSFRRLGITGECVGHGQYGSVLKGWYDGQAAVIKLYHARHAGAEDAFQGELKMYAVLAKLQGKVAPRLLCYGILDPTDAFFLAMSDEGQDLESLGLPVSERHFRQARAALKALHRAGVCHGDVRAANLVLRHDGSVCVVDFERARVLGKPRSKTDQDYVQADMADLDSLRLPQE